MRRTKRAARLGTALVVASLIAIACSPSEEAVESDAEVTTMVQPDLTKSPMTVNVTLTDTGFDPEIIFLPAGRQIRLVLRDGGTREHHYRIAGLIPTQLEWIVIPEIDTYDLDSMTPEELSQYGIDLDGVIDEAELEHILHHLSATWSPTKPESPSGVKPLGIEVHGYVIPGKVDVMLFFPVSTGRFKAEDVLYPEITGEVIVFDPNALS